ncbi:MAG: hypothetical protein ABIH72_04715 [archaeon]
MGIQIWYDARCSTAKYLARVYGEESVPESFISVEGQKCLDGFKDIFLVSGEFIQGEIRSSEIVSKREIGGDDSEMDLKNFLLSDLGTYFKEHFGANTDLISQFEAEASLLS